MLFLLPIKRLSNLTAAVTKTVSGAQNIGASAYVSCQNDNKIYPPRMEWYFAGDIPMDLELKPSVEDSSNSVGVVIDVIRCCKLALRNGVGGALEGPSAYCCKHPPRSRPS